MRDENLIQDHSSNIHTSTARHVHGLERMARVTRAAQAVAARHETLTKIQGIQRI